MPPITIPCPTCSDGTNTFEDRHTGTLIADPRDRYYGQDGAVWKAPIETRKEAGSTTISIGFKVCTMTDVVGPEAADTVADLMNAGVAAL
ncbi:hypothetical protein ONR30_23660, partial [Salmonella enterica subsp. enterica serovar Kentucky]|nr:hypothetical protein [Salmonella enterica subsp. enterica serovar Kentucky]